MMPVVGIIGGRGRMGSWFAKFFRKSGCRVLVSDLDTALGPRELVEKSDVVIFSVPIPETEKAIGKFARYAKKGSLVADFTSVKEKPMMAMLKHAPRSVEVLGMHPVFGPNTKNMRGQCVVITPGRGGSRTKWMQRLLRKNGAIVTVSSPKRHDEMMAVIQVLVHSSAIPVGHALKELGVNLKESVKFTSPVYRLRLALVGRILSQSAGLYSNIMMENPYARKVLRQYSKSFGMLAKTVENRDREAFEKYFRETARYFRPLRKEALAESKRLVDDLCSGAKGKG